MLLLILLSCLVAFATAGPPCSAEEQAVLQVYSPWEAIYACKDVTAAWDTCMNSKTGLLTQTNLVGGGCWGCYTPVFAAVSNECADSNMLACSSDADVVSALSDFWSCAGFDLRTGSTTCTGDLPSTAQDVGRAFSTAINSEIPTGIAEIASAFSGTDAVYAPCEPCYQELVVQLAYAPIVENDFATACANSGFHRTTCLAFLQPYYDLFTLCSGKTLALSVNRVSAGHRTILETGKLDVLAAKTVFGATANPPAGGFFNALLDLTDAVGAAFPSGSTCFTEYMTALALSPSPHLELCSDPTADQCPLKDEIADLQRCLGGFEMNSVAACLSHQPVLETVYKPFGDLLACSGEGRFEVCMAARTGFWAVLMNGPTGTCINCYTALANAMKTVCASFADAALCYEILTANGDLQTFNSCAGYSVSVDAGSCDRTKIAQPHLDSLWEVLPNALSMVGRSPFEMMQSIVALFTTVNYLETYCNFCYARFVYEVSSLNQVSILAACDKWKLASAGCRLALAVPLTRFKACTGWELTNDQHLQCTAADRTSTYSLLSVNTADPPDTFVYDGLSVPSNVGAVAGKLNDWAGALSPEPACKRCFSDLVSRSELYRWRRAGVFELCAAWHFIPFTADVTATSNWAPRRCSEDEIDAVAGMSWSPFVALLNAEAEILDSGTASVEPLTQWWAEFTSAFASPLTCEPCFADLKVALTEAGAYTNIDECKHHREDCTEGVHCDSGYIECPVSFAILKFTQCSGMVIPTRVGESIKADVTFPYPRPVALPASPLPPGLCSAQDWALLEDRMNHISTKAVIQLAGGDVFLAKGSFNSLYIDYFGALPSRHFACERCQAPWLVFRFKLDQASVPECVADLSASACLAIVEAQYDAMVTCAVGASTKCSVIDIGALTTASASLETLIGSAVSSETRLMATYVEALLGSSGARAARRKSCFNCFLDRARSLLALLSGGGDCLSGGAQCDAAKVVLASVDPIPVVHGLN